MSESFEIPTFEKGDSVTSTTFREKLNKLSFAIKESIVRRGIGYSVTRMGNGGGTILNITQPQQKTYSHPFQAVRTTSGGSTYVSIVSGSLLKSFKPDDRQIITGLQTQLDFSGGLVWLEMTINNDFEISAASIKTESTGSFDPTLEAWESDSFVEYNDDDNNPKQTKARVLIAYENSDGDLVQCVKSDLCAMKSCIQGNDISIIAYYCIPFFSPYVL